MTIQKNSGLSFLFLLGIIIVSLEFWLYSIFIILILTGFQIYDKEHRSMSSILVSFLVSFLFFQLASNQVENLEVTKELKILLNRCLLIIIFMGMILSQVFYKRRISLFAKLPKWSSKITLPFHTIKLSYFLFISFFVSCTLLIPPIVNEKVDIGSVFLFAVLFSIINATLEEFIWRGILLSSLSEYVSPLYAMLVTSLGFGLYHIAIGIPFGLSLLFSFGGLFYSIVVLKSNSIFPAIVLHLVINIGIVLNGWIV